MSGVNARDNPIRGPGTSLAQWQASRALQAVPTITAQLLLPHDGRLVVVAPHPDDEVLMCGGLLSRFAGQEEQLLLVSVTDGEGSHPCSLTWPASRLRQARPLESAHALERLGLHLPGLDWRRLGLPDTQVPALEGALTEQLQGLLRPGDRVLTTWRHDAHCDHDAVGRACAEAARRCDARLMEIPVWAWHWAEPEDRRLPWLRARKLMLDPQCLALKRHAIAAHTSQLSPDATTGAAPVLSPAALARLLQPFELIFL
ncbi:PIG-L deacetylase family protein [Pseudomonas sp. Irchel 3E20]|uniref:PIG-L deacetylase family protein n=1 Tax=Pseudomonas sp. Irchel 3E20 TaxID=2008983 RepID=UPI000BA477AE|nr:PIG-L family deacetylase [Pseudomonas sp. Irchel 3E20]